MPFDSVKILQTGNGILTKWQGMKKKDSTLVQLYDKYRSQKGIDQNWQKTVYSTATSGLRKMDYPIFPSALCPLLPWYVCVFFYRQIIPCSFVCITVPITAKQFFFQSFFFYLLSLSPQGKTD